MLSSDKNVETIAQLVEVLKHYFGLQKEYVKLDIIDKVVRLLTAAALALVFFLLLALAALTSAISLLEALTQWLSSEKVGRAASAILMSAAVVLLAVAASLSFGDGIWSGFKLGGMQLFDLLDKLTGTILPPVCALMTILFFGWFMKKDDIIDELSNHGTVSIRFYGIFRFIARYVAPLALLVVLVSGILS